MVWWPSAYQSLRFLGNFCGACEDKFYNFCNEKLRNTLQKLQENTKGLPVDDCVSKFRVDGLIQCTYFVDVVNPAVRCEKQNGGKIAHALPCMKLTENDISSCRMLWTSLSRNRNIMSNKHLTELK